MATLAEVLAWRPETLGTAATDLTGDKQILLGLDDELADGRVPADWSGAAAEAARDSHETIRLTLNDHVATLAAVAAAVRAAAGAVRRAQRVLEDALTHARQLGFEVDRSTGRVSDTQSTYADEHERNDRQRELDGVVDQLEQGLRAAHHADTELAQALREATSGIEGGEGDLSTAAQAGRRAGRPDMSPPPGRDAGPADWAAWFASLSPAHQQWLIANDPALIGNRDGIPAWARDQANRHQIDDHRAALQRQLDALGPEPSFYFDPARWAAWKQQHDALTNKLAGLDTIEQILAKHGDNRQLLLLDPTGSHQLKAALAVGDVDNADNVTVFTPGLTSTVKGMAGYDSDMANLVHQAEQHGGSTAAIAWLGYEAPQLDSTLFGDRTVASDRLAQAGADDLAAFYNGIDASRPKDPHLTALGHSYGSLTTGLALQHSTGVDAAVFFGSPGTGARDLSDMDIPEGRAYSMSSSTDPVANFNRFGRDPDLMEGMTRLDAAGDRTSHDGRDLTRSGGHTNYLVDGSSGQYNLAAVVAGEQDKLLIDNNPTHLDRVIDTGKNLPGDVAEFGRDVADKGREVIDRGRELAGEAYDRGREFTSEVIDRGQEVVSDTIDRGQEVVSDTIDRGKELADDVADRGREVGDKVIQGGQDLIDRLGSLGR
jgi:hypothetical protein